MQCLCLHKPAWLHSSSSPCPAEGAALGCAHSLKSRRINGHFVWRRKKMEVGGQSRQLCAVLES